MIQQYLGISPDKLIKAGWETLYMVGFSLIIGSIVGFFTAKVGSRKIHCFTRF